LRLLRLLRRLSFFFSAKLLNPPRRDRRDRREHDLHDDFQSELKPNIRWGEVGGYVLQCDFILLLHSLIKIFQHKIGRSSDQGS